MDFRERQKKKASCSTLCIQTSTHTSFTHTTHTHTQCYSRSTFHTQNRIGSLTKNPVALKALFLLKEKHTKQCSVHVKRCLSLVACFLPVFCFSKSVQHTYTFPDHTTQEGRNLQRKRLVMSLSLYWPLLQDFLSVLFEMLVI